MHDPLTATSTNLETVTMETLASKTMLKYIFSLNPFWKIIYTIWDYRVYSIDYIIFRLNESLLTRRPCWFLELRSKFLVPFFIFSIYNLLKISILTPFYLGKLKTHHCWLEQSNHFVGKSPGKTVQMWSKSKRQINHKVIRMMDLTFDGNKLVIRPSAVDSVVLQKLIRSGPFQLRSS